MYCLSSHSRESTKLQLLHWDRINSLTTILMLFWKHEFTLTYLCCL